MTVIKIMGIIAYIYDTSCWYLYDDIVSKRKIAPDNEEISPHLIIYTVQNSN